MADVAISNMGGTNSIRQAATLEKGPNECAHWDMDICRFQFGWSPVVRIAKLYFLRATLYTSECFITNSTNMFQLPIRCTTYVIKLMNPILAVTLRACSNTQDFVLTGPS